MDEGSLIHRENDRHPYEIRRSQKTKEQSDKISKTFFIKYTSKYRENVMSAQMLEVSLLGVGTVLCRQMDAWSTVK